jgi:hypothetical protein
VTALERLQTTKSTKATKGLEIFDYKLRAVRVLSWSICFSVVAPSFEFTQRVIR